MVKKHKHTILYVIFGGILIVSLFHLVFVKNTNKISIPMVTMSGVQTQTIEVPKVDRLSQIKEMATIVSLLVGSFGSMMTTAYLIKNNRRKS